jgi:chaperonin GroEL
MIGQEEYADKKAISDLITDLRISLSVAKNEDERYPIEKRIARLTGGVAVIHVGANTETEMKERMDRFDDAIRATKSAIAEGYIIGGGAPFFRLAAGNNDIMKTALCEPFDQICKNAGVETIDILDKIGDADFQTWYNAKTGQVENLIDSGVIDPTKVLRCSLENAASSATMILTSECIICDTL